ncbi:hypothetical protein KNT80_gp04 [Vibrio phage 1.245.O._10N.261.54.C7]|uniref:Uncharacterized protein n=1 Tax=Vibrio phage 1.245.O._10N.261.54.C7 TaxID=1881236 RepID=A0A2I7RW95_9CAUD|nr:hypothetical protein KNT80_gp04 [Vibrio phage 1.245.O._10N.261.54.C7]AUR97917.1 hypothetical protein NVP1245O_04 [Vibrio phage 1.245.O._10N.261.54.C7]
MSRLDKFDRFNDWRTFSHNLRSTQLSLTCTTYSYLRIQSKRATSWEFFSKIFNSQAAATQLLLFLKTHRPWALL